MYLAFEPACGVAAVKHGGVAARHGEAIELVEGPVRLKTSPGRTDLARVTAAGHSAVFPGRGASFLLSAVWARVRFSWRGRPGAGEPARQNEEGKYGSEGDDTGADQRAPAEAGDEGPVGRVDDHCVGAGRCLRRDLEGGRR